MLPSSKVRAFATWFYQLKCHLLQFEIDRDGVPAYQWENDFRTQIVSEASIQMFGEARTTMIEPPVQAESHLFQTLQCADWLCGLIGRIAATSGIRRERPVIGE